MPDEFDDNLLVAYLKLEAAYSELCEALATKRDKERYRWTTIRRKQQDFRQAVAGQR